MQTVKVGCLALAPATALVSNRLFRPDLLRTSASFHQTHFCRGEQSSEKLVVIRVPKHLQKRVDDVKQARSKLKVNTVKAGKLLIQSKNPHLNQSAGFVLGKFQKPVLSSKGWKHNKAFGDYFIVNNIKESAPFLLETEEKTEKALTTFNKFNISEKLVESLEGMGIIHPTIVQLQTVPKIMKGHNVLCAAETGSGKTLAYLLPVIHKLQQEKELGIWGEQANRIGGLVLVPSRELAGQVYSVCKSLCAPFGLHTRVAGGGRGVGRIKAVFKTDHLDILVSTPGALVKALRRHCLSLSELSFFIIDEADTMFDPSFSEMLEDILDHADIARDPKETSGIGHKSQLVVVGATFPGGVGELLSKVTDLGKMVTIKSKMLHCLMPHVTQTFLKVKGSDKVLELCQALKKIQHEKPGGASLVFCNKSATVNWLGYSLDELGIEHARLQGQMPAIVRSGIFRSFQNGNVDVLICTDIASRGLDTSRVRLVVNYDFPDSHTDYIHRAGRVGRAGGAEDTEVLSFITHPWDVELVQSIETAARRRSNLPGMDSKIHEPKPEAEDGKE